MAAIDLTDLERRLAILETFALPQPKAEPVPEVREPLTEPTTWTEAHHKAWDRFSRLIGDGAWAETVDGKLSVRKHLSTITIDPTDAMLLADIFSTSKLPVDWLNKLAAIEGSSPPANFTGNWRNLLSASRHLIANPHTRSLVGWDGWTKEALFGVRKSGSVGPLSLIEHIAAGRWLTRTIGEQAQYAVLADRVTGDEHHIARPGFCFMSDNRWDMAPKVEGPCIWDIHDSLPTEATASRTPPHAHRWDKADSEIMARITAASVA